MKVARIISVLIVLLLSVDCAKFTADIKSNNLFIPNDLCIHIDFTLQLGVLFYPLLGHRIVH